MLKNYHTPEVSNFFARLPASVRTAFKFLNFDFPNVNFRSQIDPVLFFWECTWNSKCYHGGSDVICHAVREVLHAAFE